MSDYFERIERHLTDAVDRHARGRGGQSWSLTRSRRRRIGWPRVLGAAVPICGVAVVVVVAATFLHTHSTDRPQAPSATLPTNRPTLEEQLVRDLGVLRAPQTPAERAFNHSRTVRNVERHSTINPNLTRVVRLPHGIRVGLYVETGTRGGAPGRLGITERQHQGGFGECCMSPEMLRRPSTPGPLASSSAPHPHQVYVEIVPDGVARVRWVFARSSPGYGPFPRPLKVTVAVLDNVAAANLPDRGAARTVAWYDARGHIVASHTTR